MRPVPHWMPAHIPFAASGKFFEHCVSARPDLGVCLCERATTEDEVVTCACGCHLISKEPSSPCGDPTHWHWAGTVARLETQLRHTQDRLEECRAKLEGVRKAMDL